MPLDAVGGTMLLVRADVHRDGLVFPCYPYGLQIPRIRPPGMNVWYGEIETEGLGIMAGDMGVQCWGCRTCRSSTNGADCRGRRSRRLHSNIRLFLA